MVGPISEANADNNLVGGFEQFGGRLAAKNGPSAMVCDSGAGVCQLLPNVSNGIAPYVSLQACRLPSAPDYRWEWLDVVGLREGRPLPSRYG